MKNKDISKEKSSSMLTIDKIIEKFIPVIGAIFLTIGFGYLLYTNIWVDLALQIRLGLGFFLSIIIIGGAISFSDKLKYFADIIIGSGILLLYGTLVYGSRTTDLASAVIPEVATLITSSIFTFVLSYFASYRKSKVILILSIIGAYLTPFIIGQNDIWSQNISFNSYLIYFATINIVIFLIGKELSIRNIIPLNLLGLFLGTSALYNLSYSEGISSISNINFFTGELFSAILFLFLLIFSMWSIIISSKKFEEKDEGYISFGYIATIFWFIFNLGLLNDISNITRTIFFVLISFSCFYGWHFLKDTKTRFQHTSLYAGGILSLVIAFFNLVPKLDAYSSLAIAYSSLIFGFIYILNPTRFERLISYGLLSLIGGLLSILFIYDSNSSIESFKTFYVVLALVPAMLGYFIANKGTNLQQIELAKVYSFTALILAIMYVLVEFVKFFNLGFLIYYIPTLSALIYILISKGTPNDTKSLILRSSLIWFLIGYIFVFFKLLDSLYPAPTNIYIFTNGGLGLDKDWIIIKGIFASIILFLGLFISRNFQKNRPESQPSFILVILGYSSLLLIVNYIIFAIINDLSISSLNGGIRSVSTTLWWVFIAIFMLMIGIKKGKFYCSEKLLGLLLLVLTLCKIILFDLATMEMQNKIIVLMIVGGALMMFSYFVHTKGLLKTNEKLL